jgi:hypothetical protein
VKPDTGQTNRSFWKTFFLNAESSPTGTINNIKWFTDGALGWTGMTLRVGVTSGYTQATGTLGTTGDASAVATTDATTYTSASPLSVTGSITNPNTGKITDYVVLQVSVSDTAAAGLMPTENVTWRYDET